MLKIFLIVLIIFLPKYGIIDLSFFLSLVVIIFYTIILKVNSLQHFRLYKTELLFFSLLIIYFSVQYIVNIFFLDNIYVPYYLGKFVRLLINFLAICFLLHKFNILNTYKVFNIIFILNISVIFFELLFPEYKDIIYGITNFGHGNYIDITYRVAGLSFGHDAAGMLVVFGGLFYLILLNKTKENKIFNSILYILHFLATIITARVAFLILVFLSFLFMIIISFKYFIKIFKFILILVSFGIILYYIIYFSDYKLDGIEYAIDRTFNIERYTNDSTDLANSFKVSESLFHHIIGYGLDPFGKYGARSDVGFFQMYWAAGILGTLLIVLFYIKIFLKALKNYKYNILAIYIVFIIMAIFIGTFKGGYIFARQQSEILFVAIILYYSAMKNFKKII